MHPLRFAEATDVGRERSENQDACGHLVDDQLAAFFTCDGMGGHAGGSTASRLAVDTLRKQFELSEAELPGRLASAIRAANLVIHQHAKDDRTLRGMGTTVVLLVFDPPNQRAWWAHVGDSRIYLVRGDTIRRLTRDHTMVQSLVDDGIITRDEAKNHPRSNMISRSLGSRPEVDVDVSEPFELEPGDSFVLCSDGLHGLVDEAEIARTLRELDDQEAVDRLIERANEEGGPDNITVQIVHWDPPDSLEPVEAWKVEHPPILRTRSRDDDASEDAARADAPPPPVDPQPVDAPLTEHGPADDDDDPLATLLLAVLLGVVIIALIVVFSRGRLDVVPPAAEPDPTAEEGSAEPN